MTVPVEKSTLAKRREKSELGEKSIKRRLKGETGNILGSPPTKDSAISQWTGTTQWYWTR